MPFALLEAEHAQKLRGSRAGFAARQPPDHLGQHDILEGGEFPKKIMRLIDEADGLPANPRASGVV